VLVQSMSQRQDRQGRVTPRGRGVHFPIAYQSGTDAKVSSQKIPFINQKGGKKGEISWQVDHQSQ